MLKLELGLLVAITTVLRLSSVDYVLGVTSYSLATTAA